MRAPVGAVALLLCRRRAFLLCLTTSSPPAHTGTASTQGVGLNNEVWAGTVELDPAGRSGLKIAWTKKAGGGGDDAGALQVPWSPRAGFQAVVQHMPQEALDDTEERRQDQISALSKGNDDVDPVVLPHRTSLTRLYVIGGHGGYWREAHPRYDGGMRGRNDAYYTDETF